MCQNKQKKILGYINEHTSIKKNSGQKRDNVKMKSRTNASKKKSHHPII